MNCNTCNKNKPIVKIHLLFDTYNIICLECFIDLMNDLNSNTLIVKYTKYNSE